MILSANESAAPDPHHRRSGLQGIAKKGAVYVSFDWQSVGRIDRSRLAQARLQAHYAAQWLARAARAFLPPRPEDGHTNLGWEDALPGFETHALPDGTVLGLNVPDLALVLRNGQDAPEPRTISLDARRDADIRESLGRALGAHGADAGKLDAALPYDMPEHPIGHGAPYRAAGLAAASAELAAWFANANHALSGIRQRLLARGLNAPPVRCWPHHFDLDTLLALGAAAPAPSVGIGFSPGDGYYDEPYFYVSRYPAPDSATLPPLPGIGHWHSNRFTAAIAVGHKIVEATDRQAEVEMFLRAATDIMTAAR
jgi:hypothetical protein